MALEHARWIQPIETFLIVWKMSEISALKSSSFSRRHFISLGFFGLLVALVGESLYVTMRFLKPQSKGGFGGLVYAGKVDEFPKGSVTHIESARAYIVRTEEGMLSLWQRCTHLGCAVPWEESQDRFHCPCHGSLFDKTGVVIGGPAPRPLDTFTLEIKKDEVWIDTGKPEERNKYDPSQLTRV